MKFLKLVLAITILGIAPASANDQGAWVKVDNQGNAIGQAIVCTSDVCGNPDSLFNKLTLGSGERYVLQFKADPETGNVAGMGAGEGLKLDFETNQWSKSQSQTYITPDLKVEKSTTAESWKSGDYTYDRKVDTKVENLKVNTESWDWDYLLLLPYKDLVKWFSNWINTIYLK